MAYVASYPLDLDLLTVLIAYLFLPYGRVAVCFFAFGQGLVMDLFSTGLHGLFTFLYLMVYGSIYVGCRLFDLQGRRGQIIITSMAVMIKELMLVALMFVFSVELVLLKSSPWVSLFSAIGTGLIAPLLFFLFEHLRTVFSRFASLSSSDL